MRSLGDKLKARLLCLRSGDGAELRDGLELYGWGIHCLPG